MEQPILNTTLKTPNQMPKAIVDGQFIGHGVFAIANERRRQIDEHGYDVKHDAQNSEHQLEIAAACYALSPTDIIVGRYAHPVEPGLVSLDFEDAWPWGKSFDKREYFEGQGEGGRLHELATAGALIAAAYDLELQRIVDLPKKESDESIPG